MRVGWADLVLVGVVACSPRAPPPGAAGPVEAVQAFAAAVQRGDAAAAWSLLSARAQRDADRLAQEAREKTGGASAQSGRQMLFGSALPAGKVTARETAQDGGAAEVLVDAPEGQRSYRVVREGDAWKLDLD